MISNLKRSNDFMKKFRKLTQSKRKKPQPVRAALHQLEEFLKIVVSEPEQPVVVSEPEPEPVQPAVVSEPEQPVVVSEPEPEPVQPAVVSEPEPEPVQEMVHEQKQPEVASEPVQEMVQEQEQEQQPVLLSAALQQLVAKIIMFMVSVYLHEQKEIANAIAKASAATGTPKASKNNVFMNKFRTIKLIAFHNALSGEVGDVDAFRFVEGEMEKARSETEIKKDIDVAYHCCNLLSRLAKECGMEDVNVRHMEFEKQYKDQESSVFDNHKVFVRLLFSEMALVFKTMLERGIETMEPFRRHFETFPKVHHSDSNKTRFYPFAMAACQ